MDILLYCLTTMYVLEPTSIAVIGASAEEKKLGHYILKNLLTQGFTGTVYPVNPKHDELMGVKAYPSVEAIAGTVDMAIVVTPASTVHDVAESCGKKGIKTLVVISAGFGELGTEEAHEREQRLLQIARNHGMSMVGPNCLGVLRPSIGLNASFAVQASAPGNIALISQSGAMAVALMDAAANLSMGYSFVASIGNKTDLDECDFLEICESDSKTAAIGLYLESIKDGPRFAQIAKRVSKTKPIVLIKSGVSKRGSMAVSSHTGALAGSSAAIDALCRQAGIHRAENTGVFLDVVRTLASQPALLSPNIAIVTNAGGPGVLATDAAEREGLVLAALAEATKQSLKQKLPVAASVANPVDVLGDALADRYVAAIGACAQDPEVDGIVALLTPQVMTPCTEIAKAIVQVSKVHPFVPIVAAFMGNDSVAEARAILGGGGVPQFATPEEAIRALKSLASKAHPLPDTKEEDPRADDRRSAATGMLQDKGGLLPEETVEELLALYALPVPDQAVARSAAEAVECAEQIGYPVIAKISSPDILHKTDIGGVRANLQTATEVKKAYDDILKNCAKHEPSAGIHGVLIQKFLPVGNEFIVGALRDPSFGPLVMVGLGGIYTELFHDTAFRLAPVSEQQAYEMLQQLKSWKLLLGMRGKGQADIAELARTIVAISQLVSDCPKVKELDLNPVLVHEKGVIIADAKIVVDETGHL